MSEARKNVLANMFVNLRIERLLGFVNTLALMKGKHYDVAAAEMLNPKWAQQVGIRGNPLGCDHA